MWHPIKILPLGEYSCHFSIHRRHGLRMEFGDSAVITDAVRIPFRVLFSHTIVSLIPNGRFLVPLANTVLKRDKFFDAFDALLSRIFLKIYT